MEGPQEPILRNREAQERRLVELEAAQALALGERIAPLDALDRDLDAVEDFLHRLGDAAPAEARAQHRMALGEALPGARPARLVERLAQRHRHLLDVSAVACVAEAVHQHPGLHRRERVAIDYARHAASARQAAGRPTTADLMSS